MGHADQGQGMSEQDTLGERVAAPYTSGDLIRLATDRRGVQPLDPARVLATYAHPDNWVSVNAQDENGEMRHYWSWAGPMIVGYELAGYGLRAIVEAALAGEVEA